MTRSPPSGLHAVIPRADYLHQSTRALHEWLGRAGQALRNHLLRLGD